MKDEDVVRRLEEAGYFGDRIDSLKQRFKNAANATGQALGSAEAGGRYEVGVVVRQLMQLWSRYKGINNIKEGTTPHVVAFIKTLGFAMSAKDVSDIYAGVYKKKSGEEQAAADLSPKTDPRSPQMRKQISMLATALVKKLSADNLNNRAKIDSAFKDLITNPSNPKYNDGSKLFTALRKIEPDDRVVLFKMAHEGFKKQANEPHEWGTLFAKYYQGIEFSEQIWTDKLLISRLWPETARLIIQSGAASRVFGDDENDVATPTKPKRAAAEAGEDEPSEKKKSSRKGGLPGDTQLVNFDRLAMDLRLQRVLPRGMGEALTAIEADNSLNDFDDIEKAIATKFGNNPSHLIHALAAFMAAIKSGS